MSSDLTFLIRLNKVSNCCGEGREGNSRDGGGTELRSSDSSRLWGTIVGLSVKKDMAVVKSSVERTSYDGMRDLP